MSTLIRILILEDSAADAELMLHELHLAGFDTEWQRVETEPDFLAGLETNPDLILSDWSLPQFSGSRALQLINERGLDIPFVIVSGLIGEEAAVEAMRQGAADYILKDRLARLGQSVLHALKSKRMQEERKRDVEQLRYQAVLLANVNDAIIASDSQYRLTAWNPAAEALYGWKAEEVLGQDGLEIMRTEWPGAEAQLMRRTIADAKRWRGEATQARRDGTRFSVEMSIIVLQDESGQITGYISVNHDITEHKEAVEAIRDSEQKYRQLVDNASETIVVAQDGIMKFVNRMASDLSGYSEQELTSRPFSEFIHPDDREMVIESYLSRIKGNVDKPRYVFRLIVSDGSIKWVEISAILIDWEGKPATLNFLTDVTARKQAEQALKDSEKRFRDIADNAQEWIWEVDAQGKYTYASQMVEKVLGYTPQEILDKYFYDLFHPEDREVFKAAALAAFAAKQPFREFINRNVHKNGHTIWFSTSALPLLDDKGNLLGYRGADTDITERKRSEDALRESEANYRTLVENIPQKIFMKNRKSKFLSINENFARDLGIRSADIVGKTDYDFYPKDLADHYRAGDIRILETGQTEELEEKFMQAGRETWIHTIKTPVRDENDEIVAVLGVFWDITESKRAEILLNEQLEELRRWHQATLGREMRLIDLKREVNELLIQAGHPLRYASTETENQ